MELEGRKEKRQKGRRDYLRWLTKSVVEQGLKLEGCTFMFYI